MNHISQLKGNLRSKRFLRRGSSRKLEREQKKINDGGGGGERFLLPL